MVYAMKRVGITGCRTMTELERNKQIVREFFDLMNEGRVADAFAMTSPDFVWWGGAGDTAAGITLTAEELIPVESEFMRKFDGPLVTTLGVMTAEEDRVVVEAETYGTLKNGKVYNNSYSQHFVIRDGRIVSWREHYNTALVEKIAGDLLRESGNPTVS